MKINKRRVFSIGLGATVMQINEISLENFRSYGKSIEIREFLSVNAFIGPNSAGKSNVFEAMRYLRGLAGIGETPRNFDEVIFDREPNLVMRIKMAVSLSQNERAEIIERLFRDNSRVLPQSIKKSPFFSEVILGYVIERRGVTQEMISVKNIVEGFLPILRWRSSGNQMNFDSINIDKKCSELDKMENIPEIGYEQRETSPMEFRILRASSSVPRTELDLLNKLRDFMSLWLWFPPIRQAQPRLSLGEERILHPSGGNLARFLNTLQSQNPRKFVALSDNSIGILPFVEEILAPTRGSEATVDIRENGLRNNIDLANVSFGLMQVLILAYGIVTSSAGSVILIEEPELHLHARSQRKLFELIQKEAAQKQFFLTTHCSVFTGCSNRVRTYLVTKNGGITSVKQIPEPSELKLVKTALGHRNTDLYGDECVVFIEGDSEDVAFPIIADALGYDLVEQGIRLTNLKGSGKAKKIEEYLRYLKGSDVLAYIIADGDKEVKKSLADWIREGLLREDCATVWPLEFEDCFDLQTIAEAVDELRKEEKWNVPITMEELKDGQVKGKPVAKQLQRLMYEKDLPGLHKPALAEKLAERVKEDIQTNKERKKSLPESEIEKIVSLVSQAKET